MIINRLKKFIDNQYKSPKGLIGLYIGEKMVRQHQPETLWTINLLGNLHDENILELGCGAGYAMKLILEQSKARQVVGLDVSPTVVRSAAIRNSKAINNGRASLVQENVNKLPFQDEEFNKVYSIHSIYFWDNLPQAISEIYRVLKHNGKLIITLCDGKDGETWSDIKNMVEQKLLPILEKNGFINVETLTGPSSRQFHTTAVIAYK